MTGQRYSPPTRAAEWSVTATAENVTTTASVPGVAGKSHYITYIGGSYSASSTGGEMLLKEGDKIVGDYFVHGQRGVPLTFPLKIAEGQAVSLSIVAGGLAVKGACSLQGYTL